MPRHPDASWTTDSLQADVFTALRERVETHRGPLHLLHVGDTFLEPVEAARVDRLATGDLEGVHRYAPVHGLPELLGAIERKIERRTGRAIPRELLQVTAGATGGLSCTCQALLDPGDEVVIPSPFWPLIRGIVSSRGAVPVEVPFWDRLGDPGFDPEAAIARAITEKTAAIYLNSPNNPTGRILPDDLASAVARLARRHDLWIFSDGVYEDLWLGEREPVTPLWTRDDLFDRTVAVHSVSKGYAMAGARVGFAHGPPEAMGAIRAVQTFHTYCAATPMQLAAARALDEGDTWLDDARSIYTTEAWMASEALNLPMPEGGTFLFFDATPWLPDGAGDVTPFLHRSLDEGVVVTPGAASGEAYGSFVRVCFTTLPPSELAEGLASLRRALG